MYYYATVTTTTRNAHNSTVSVTPSNKISLEDTIKEHSPKNLKGKTIDKITIKETKKEFYDSNYSNVKYKHKNII